MISSLLTASDLTPGRPDISILLISWNTRELTKACLATLAASVAAGISFETIVVDNGSTDGSLESLRAEGLDVLIENDRNVGYAAAVNQAYARSRGDLVLLLNSDVRFHPGSLGVLVRFLRERPEVAGVGPLYLNPDGSVQQHHYRLPTMPMMLAGVSRVFGLIPAFARSVRRYRMLDEDFSAPRAVPQPSASVLLLRRAVLPTDHLLDERFPIFFNDVELAYRLTSNGHDLWMTPESVVVHDHGASTRLLGTSLVRHHLGAQIRYLELTQPRSLVWLFRLVVLVQKLAALALHRQGALPLRELTSALRGDPGPLPQLPR